MIFLHERQWDLLASKWGAWFLVEVLGFVLVPCVIFAYAVRHVLFTVVMVGSVVAGLCIILLYLFKRRRWQHMFVLVFGALMVVVGLALLAQQGAPQDIEFLGLLLGGAGVVFVALGALVRPRMVSSAQAKE